ncbi:cytochrome P450 [Dactylosporangium sp. CA-233914]|uniref:cytochrome P450 n=1 Tax=Dactylosporangium sp. CA-233914 TaxID=3239934 RepID=UPI003D901DB2
MTSAKSTQVPFVSLDYFTAEFNANPYPKLDELREIGPVVYNEYLDHWAITSFKIGSRVLANPREFRADRQLESVFGGATMQVEDSALHGEIRGVWARDFQRDTLDEQRAVVDEAVRSAVDPFVERLRAGETVDAVRHMTRGIPVQVIAQMLGIGLDPQTLRQVAEWSDLMGAIPSGLLDPSPAGEVILQKGAEATRALHEFIGAEMDKRRLDPTSDLISKMTNSSVANQLSERDLRAGNSQLIFAGNETTAKLMANIIVALGDHPDQRRAVGIDHSLIPAVIEEVLRWQSVSQVARRVVRGDDVFVDGIQIPDGARVVVLLGACNRDPDRWDEPDKFDIRRERRQHLGFSFGIHTCLGQNLARLESAVWLEQFLERLPDYELAGDIDYGPGFAVRGPEAVPIRL